MVNVPLLDRFQVFSAWIAPKEYMHNIMSTIIFFIVFGNKC